MINLPNKALFRPDEVAEYLSVSRKTVYNWIALGKLEAVKISSLLRIPKEKLIEFQKSTIE
jgi:excisionase family DNA binding protein